MTRPGEQAETAAGAVRALLRVTLPGQDSYQAPGDVYDVLGALHQLIADLPQVLDQARRWLGSEHRAGRIATDHGDAGESVVVGARLECIAISLDFAARNLSRALPELDDARGVVSHLTRVDRASDATSPTGSGVS